MEEVDAARLPRNRHRGNRWARPLSPRLTLDERDRHQEVSKSEYSSEYIYFLSHLEDIEMEPWVDRHGSPATWRAETAAVL